MCLILQINFTQTLTLFSLQRKNPFILYTGETIKKKKNIFQYINIILTWMCHNHMPKNDLCRKVVPNYLWISFMNPFFFQSLLPLQLYSSPLSASGYFYVPHPHPPLLVFSRSGITSLIDLRSLAMSLRTDDSLDTAASLSCFFWAASVWKFPTNYK